MTGLSAVFRIAVGDTVSKIIIIGINLYLIRRLTIDQYSHFTLLLNAVFLGYQLACGPLERLYIAEHDRYREHLTQLQWVLSAISAMAVTVWWWREVTWQDKLIIVAGVFLLAAYQVMRIRLQQRQNFSLFSLAEILKNGLWLAFLILFLSVPLLPAGTVPLLSLITGTLVAMALLKVAKATNLPIVERHETNSQMTKVLWETRYVIAYSLIGAVVPYLPLIMAATIGDDTITATYGAAIRYQAILGMAVFAFNTALLPQMAALGRDGYARDLLMQRLKHSAPLALFLILLTILTVWYAIPYVDQGKYPLLPKIFLILSITPALSLISAPFVNILLVDGRARVVLICMSAGVIISIAGYFLIGSSRNLLAPALASLLAYLTITCTIVLFATCRKSVHTHSD